MSQETLADNQDCRVRTTRNIVFVAFPDVELLDVCGPFDVFAFAGADKGREVFSSLSVETHSRPDLRGLQTWILAHPHADLSIEALAERVAMSPRNFARLFVQETGMTPAKFVEQARLEVARCALEQTVLPVEAIVERCGFGDPRRMHRSFRRLLGVSLGLTPRGVSGKQSWPIE
jgi:transcriptional regulator GlxA family with amidase domain